MTNIRLGHIVKDHDNALMLVSPNYEEVVTKLATHTFDDSYKQLLACLVTSQTEEQYKKYMILALKDLDNIEQQLGKLIELWQRDKLVINDDDFEPLFTDEEYELVKDKGFEDRLNDHPELLEDSFNMAFYPTMKKSMIYWRRLAEQHLENYRNLTPYQRLLLHFVTAQMLVSWESSCIDLGLMLLDDWVLDDIAKRFTMVWPIYATRQLV